MKERPIQPIRGRLLASGGVVLAIAALVACLGWIGATRPRSPATRPSKPSPAATQVAGAGSLRPVEARLVTAVTEGRVDRIHVYPGSPVQAGTVILELSNSELQESAQFALTQVQAAEGDLASVRGRSQETLLDKRSTLATIKASCNNARMELDALEALAKDGLVARLVLNQAREKWEDLSTRLKIEQERLRILENSPNGQVGLFQAKADGAKALWQLKQQQVAALTVRAGMGGVLESLMVQAGQHVGPGSTLARVVEPGQLKAELKVAETLAKDLRVGQTVTIDTRNGLVPGRIIRIDLEALDGTVTVDASLEGPLPRGARPGLNVTGLIDLDPAEAAAVPAGTAARPR